MYKDKNQERKGSFSKNSGSRGGYNNRRDSRRDGYSDNRRDFDNRDDIYSDDEGPQAIVGRSAVRELLKSGRTIDKIFIQRGEREGSITVLAAEAISRKIPIIEVDRAKLDRMSVGIGHHQGIAALASEKEYVSVEEILDIAAERGEKPLIVISDGIVDPHNLGAVIRCAEGAGAHGVIIPKRRSASLTASVSKASAGAVEHMPIAKVTNIAATIDDLKKRGIWIFAAEAGGTNYTDADFDTPAAIVMGSEGDGVSRLVKDKSDFIVSLPMKGKVNSLNVSTAAAVLLYEAARQRELKK